MRTQISEAEYLSMSFDGPEPDYLDGELVERAMPTESHSFAARNFNRTLARLDPSGLLQERPEIRLRVATRRFRVVDLAIFDRKPTAEIPPETPLVAVEFLSPGDNHGELMRKFEEYELLGIPHIWLVDPMTHRFSIYRAASLTSVQELSIPGHNVTFRLADIFG